MPRPGPSARRLPLVLCGLFPPLLLRLAPRATPKPQGQDAQPPAFLPCFPLGDVPQNTQPSGGSGSLAGPLGTHLKALAPPGGLWGSQSRGWLAGGRSRDEPLGAGRTAQDPPVWLCGLGPGGGGSPEAGRETSGMWRRRADTHIFRLPGSWRAGTAEQGQEPGPGDTAGQRSQGFPAPAPCPRPPGRSSPAPSPPWPSQDSRAPLGQMGRWTPWGWWAPAEAGGRRAWWLPGGPSRPGRPGPAAPSQPEASLASGSEMIRVG